MARNKKNYPDPFSDVTLNAVYTRPDESKVEFRGFHDGGGIWRIRFMPDVLGLWRYEAIFSDGQPGTSGEFHCVKSGVRGMISSFESNPVWFGFKDNGPMLLRSFHVIDKFFAENFPTSARELSLDWAQQQGYNMLSVASFGPIEPPLQTLDAYELTSDNFYHFFGMRPRLHSASLLSRAWPRA